MNWIQHSGFTLCWSSAVVGVGWAIIGKLEVAVTVATLGVMIGFVTFVAGGVME